MNSSVPQFNKRFFILPLFPPPSLTNVSNARFFGIPLLLYRHIFLPTRVDVSNSSSFKYLDNLV